MNKWKQKLDTILVAITFAEAGEWSMAEDFMNQICKKTAKKKTFAQRTGPRPSKRVRLQL